MEYLMLLFYFLAGSLSLQLAWAEPWTTPRKLAAAFFWPLYALYRSYKWCKVVFLAWAANR